MTIKIAPQEANCIADLTHIDSVERVHNSLVIHARCTAIDLDRPGSRYIHILLSFETELYGHRVGTVLVSSSNPARVSLDSGHGFASIETIRARIASARDEFRKHADRKLDRASLALHEEAEELERIDRDRHHGAYLAGGAA